MMIWKITNNKDWASLAKQFAWVADMQNVPQHKMHHAEGNVAIHTQMVLNELTAQPAYKELDAQRQEILWAAALLHDVEKRSTSVDEGNGAISASGHARRGEFTAREILYKEVETPFAIREQVASLVRFHGLPLWLMEKNDPQKEVLKTSLRLENNMLKMLSEADARGRICEDPDILNEALQLFELFCKENKCWNQPYPFPSASARFHYFNTPDSYADYVPFDNFKCEVTILSGLPGMGKDHYIGSLSDKIPVVSLDAIRREYKLSPTDKSANGWVVQQAKEQAREYLRKGQNFIWNATNITKMMRSQLVDLFISYGAKVKIVYIEKPYKEWMKQNRNRECPVPDKVLNDMFRKLEIPQLTEAHDVEYIVNDF